MNDLERRIKALQAKLGLLKPATPPPPPLVLRFHDATNCNAPSGTERGETSYLVMKPLRCTSPLREGAYTQEEWLANFEAKPHSE